MHNDGAADAAGAVFTVLDVADEVQLFAFAVTLYVPEATLLNVADDW